MWRSGGEQNHTSERDLEKGKDDSPFTSLFDILESNDETSDAMSCPTFQSLQLGQQQTLPHWLQVLQELKLTGSEFLYRLA